MCDVLLGELLEWLVSSMILVAANEYYLELGAGRSKTKSGSWGYEVIVYAPEILDVNHQWKERWFRSK